MGLGARRRRLRARALVLQVDAGRDEGRTRPALYGPVPPLRLLNLLTANTEDRLAWQALSPACRPWPAAAVVGPHQLQRPNVRPAQCDGDVRAGLENPSPDRGDGD